MPSFTRKQAYFGPINVSEVTKITGVESREGFVGRPGTSRSVNVGSFIARGHQGLTRKEA